MNVLVRPLNGNKALGRWRFVIKDGSNATVYSSQYEFPTEAAALHAGRARLQPGSLPKKPGRNLARGHR